MLNFTIPENIDWNRIIPEEVAYGTAIWLGVVALNCLNGLGIVSNIINIIVFVKLGLKERVNFTLFWLSVADLMRTVAQAARTKGLLWDVELGPILMNGQSFNYLLWPIKAMWGDLSSGLTMFISIERCVCVVRPLHFNSSVIARHGKKIVLIIVVGFILYYLPLMIPYGFEATCNEETNTSLYYIVYSSFTYGYSDFIDYFAGTIICVLLPCLIFVCSILMLRGLQKSSNARRALTGSFQRDQTLTESGLSIKERRVVKMVFVLACLYMFSFFPQILVIIIYNYFDTFGSEAKQVESKNLILIIDPLSFFISGTYGAFSIFVYYFFSSTFHHTIHSMFTVKSLMKKM
ncbi:P2Y purinoceptor 2 [Biomphalaria glabrata]|nr:P2Y purinoceptor 2-like [Biomphalaria glabrata]